MATGDARRVRDAGSPGMKSISTRRACQTSGRGVGQRSIAIAALHSIANAGDECHGAVEVGGDVAGWLVDAWLALRGADGELQLAHHSEIEAAAAAGRDCRRTKDRRG
jgi:hypothetical protein